MACSSFLCALPQPGFLLLVISALDPTCWKRVFIPTSCTPGLYATLWVVFILRSELVACIQSDEKRGRRKESLFFRSSFSSRSPWSVWFTIGERNCLRESVPFMGLINWFTYFNKWQTKKFSRRRKLFLWYWWSYVNIAKFMERREWNTFQKCLDKEFLWR